LLIQIESHLTNAEHSNETSIIVVYLNDATVLKTIWGEKFLLDDKLILRVCLSDMSIYCEHFKIHWACSTRPTPTPHGNKMFYFLARHTGHSSLQFN